MTAHWIKVEKDTATKPEVMRLAALLEIDEFTVVGHLIAFWSWVDSNLSPECPRTQGTIRGLDRIAGRTGFCEAMIAVGWLSHADGMFEIPKMGRHMGKSAKLRAEDTEKKAKKRSRQKVSPVCPPAQGTESGQNPDSLGTREEKRREEEKDTHGPNGEQGQPYIPERMNTPECLKAYSDWCAYLDAAGLEQRNPKYNGPQAEALWAQANKIGPDRWPDCVRYSIANGYQSIIARTEAPGAGGGKGSKSAQPDTDPDFLRAVQVCKEFPSGSDFDREKREAALGPLIRVVRKMTSARLAECDNYTRKQLAAEWKINREALGL
ncbi:MAG: hypothetical protein ACK528_07260 [Alphaproteobacteria bacterium]